MGLSVSEAGAEQNASTSDESPEPDHNETHAVQQPVALDVSVPELEGEHERAEVLLELTIDESGKVEKATVIRGEEPFASSAFDATPRWRFLPAEKDGTPVRAKFLFLVTFKPIAPEPPVASDDSENKGKAKEAPKPISRAESTALDEVVVVGKLRDPAATSFSRAEVENLPGAFGDPLRAIEAMPGVTPIASGLPLFFVRGAPPGNVGYFIDGIRVPLLYHAFLGPSVIHPAFIKNVHLSGGPMPAEYGRFAGAAVEAELAEPSYETRGEASLRLIDAGAYAEGGTDDGRAYAMLGGRYSYTALLVSAFSPGTRLDYWDYQARIGYALGDRDDVSVLALGAFDYVGSDGEVLGGTEFHRIDLRYGHRFGRQTKLRVATTWGRDRTRSDEGFLSDHVLGARLDFSHRYRNVLLRTGADVWVDRYKMEIAPAIAEPEVYVDLFPARTDKAGGVWADLVLFPESPIQIIPGLRADIFSSLGEERVSLDPRLSSVMRLTPSLRAIHSVGVSHQSPNFVPNVPGAQVAGLNGGLQRALQASTKYEADFPFNLTSSVTLFLNGTENLTDPIGLGQTLTIDETSDNTRARGKAYGVELMIKRPLTRHLGGLLSYTFSRAERTLGPIKTVPGYDRPHVLNGALSYDFGYNIRASAKLAYASGIPGRRTTLDGFVFDESRSRPYVRLDSKLEKRFVVSDTFEWGAHIEVLNSTYSGNVTTRKCTVSGCEDEGTLPITFPSLGLDAVWN